MRKKLTPIAALFLAFSLLLSGCGGTSSSGSGNTEEGNTNSTSDSVSSAASRNSADYFSDRDFDTSYEESKSAVITLNGDSAVSSSDAVSIDGSTITITDEGTYILSGSLENGMVIVNSEKTDKTQLVLDNVSIHSETSAAIYILQSDKVFITTASDTTNTLSNGGSFTAIDENNIDSVIFSKEDLTLNGSGTLVITSPAGHGIVSKDSLTITGGSYDISSASHGLAGKDDVCIANGEFSITSGKDGIHAENTDDTSYGYVYIQNGSFALTSQGDGISAGAYMQIEDGSFTISSGGGSANAASRSSDSWGKFTGGGRHQRGEGKGGWPGSSTAASSDTGEESSSMKGLKAGAELIINGGSFTIDSADDSLHSNTSLTVGAGDFQIASGDDAFHADDTLTVTGGTILISESYEGLEGLHILISGGDLTLTSSDDGLNAAGGVDASGTGGRDTMWGKGSMASTSTGSILITGGSINITAYGDGIDANGTLEITGGYTQICGPTRGDTATLDYDISAVISGGTFIGTGAMGMAQTFTSSKQGVVALNLGACSAGTTLSLSDEDGNTLLTHTPQLDYQVVIFSSPELITGQTYQITAGSTSGEVTAN